MSDELQRLVYAFNSKLQADSVFQQREQQKCALLFAEVPSFQQTNVYPLVDKYSSSQHQNHQTGCATGAQR